MQLIEEKTAARSTYVGLIFVNRTYYVATQLGHVDTALVFRTYGRWIGSCSQEFQKFA